MDYSNIAILHKKLKNYFNTNYLKTLARARII